MKLAFIDTETLGTDHVNHPIWEIAVIVREAAPFQPGYSDVEYRWTIHPGRALGCADPVALRLTHFYDRYHLLPDNERYVRWWQDEKEQSSLTTVAQAMVDIAGLTAGRHMVGAVVSFDTERLDTLMRENGVCPAWHHHIIDVEALAVGYLAAAAPTNLSSLLADKGWDSRALSREVGVTRANIGSHEAMVDARWARDLYDAIVR